MSKEHTPTPWQIHKFKSAWDDSDLLVVNAIGASPVGRNQKASVESADGLHVLDVYGATEAEALANARLALRAVNNHAPLKEALGELLNRFYPHTCDRGAMCAKCGALVAAQAVFDLADKDS